VSRQSRGRAAGFDNPVLPENLTRRNSFFESALALPEIGRPSGGDRRSNVHQPNARRSCGANA
jgi:hypothetical protein